MEIFWHSLSPEQIFEKLSTSSQGLSSADSVTRLAEHGSNVLPENKPPSWLAIFLRQFNSPLILILIGAALVTYLIGEESDAYIILAVLVFNAIIGAVQEGRAQNTLLALKKYVETKAVVIRDGKEIIVPDTDLVPGDIISIAEGDKIPADARIISAFNLRIDESSLTGESEPVMKVSEIVSKGELSVADRKNMVWKGTHSVAGSAQAVVVATGSNTVIGKVAWQISSIDTEIPLKANIRYLSRAIILAVGAICLVLFAVGLVRGESVRTMFTTVVSLAVSIIPEGLPVVLTLVLASGVWRMSKRNALVKKLQAIEALGQARVIAVDKTGTITRNELVVRQVWTAGSLYEIGGTGYEPVGDVAKGQDIVDAANHPELLLVGKSVSLASSARLS